MGGLVNKSNHEQHPPELDQVGGALLTKVVVKRNIRPDHVPFGNENARFKNKQNDREEDHPAVVNILPDFPVQQGEVAIRVPCRKLDMGNVEAGAMGPAAALRDQL